MRPDCIHALIGLILYLVVPVAAIAVEQGTSEETRGDTLTARSSLREVGYRVGDVVRQSVVVETPPGYRFDPASLPSIGKNSGFVELRDVSWRSEEGRRAARHALVLEWQVFQVLQEVRAYSLMPLQLKFRNGDRVLQADVKPASAIVSTMLPARLDTARLLPLPDVKPQPRDMRGTQWGLLASLSVVLLTLTYLVWYFDWLKLGHQRNRPFRMACRDLRAMRGKNGDGTRQIRAAMKILRQACDGTVGAALSHERLPLLFQSNPWLSPLRSELEQLYAYSDRVFFAGERENVDFEALYRLGRKLRALESGGR